MLRACKNAAAWRLRRRIHATQAVLSTASYSFSPSSLSERVGAEHEDWREVGVFWDIENCSVPSSVDPFVVRPNIERALRTSGFLGPINVAGYANINTLCRGHTLESLTESGITIHHVPSDGRDASDRALLIDVMFWTMKHSPPAHIMLISGDSDFTILMNKLRLLGYNVLLAAPFNNGIQSMLLHAASKIWIWPDVILGEPEGLVAENHVPGTLLPVNLVSKKKESGRSQSSLDSHEDLGQDGGWLPPHVVNRIVGIVKERPGISLGELTKELKARNVNPKVYGFSDYYHCLLRMDQLETRSIDGLGLKEGLTFYVPSNIAADKKSDDASPRKDSSRSCGSSHHKEAFDVSSWDNQHKSKEPNDGSGSQGNSVQKEASGGNIQHKTKEADGDLPLSADGMSSTKKFSGQEKRIAPDTRRSWGARLIGFIKGS